MIVTCVMVSVLPEHVEDFIGASRLNHEASIMEAGNMRFDVLQTRQDPTQFILYEAYETEAASAAHKETPHYLKWRSNVADWMAKPRQGIACDVVSPEERSKW